MKLTRKKIGKLCPAVVALIMGSLVVGNLFADQAEKTSAFDTLVQESLEKAVEKSAPSAPTVNDGWAAIVPNAKRTDSKKQTDPVFVAKKETLVTQISSQTTEQSVGDVFSVVVANPEQKTEAYKNQEVKQENKTETQKETPQVSVWDAIPVTVSSNTTEDDSADSAKEVLVAMLDNDSGSGSSSEGKTEENAEKTADDKKKKDSDSSNEMKPEENAENESVEKEESKTEETAKTESVMEAPQELVKTETAMEAAKEAATTETKSEAKEEPAKEEKKTEEVAKSEEKIENETAMETAVEEKPTSDMVSMLNELEQKNIEEKTKEEKTEESKSALEMVAQPLPQPEVVIPDFDDIEAEEPTKYSLIDGNKVGDPHSKDKIKLMYDEIVNGLKARNMTGRYELFKNYARGTLRGTSGLNTGSEVDGRCRLTWYTQLFRDPIFSVFAVEEFSRQLHHGLSGTHRHIAEVMGMIRKKLDVPGRNDQGILFPRCETPMEAINEVKRCLLEAQMAHARAMSVLTPVEQKEVDNNIVATFTGPNAINGHTIPNRTYGRRLVNIIETIDKAAMHDAAEALLPLTNEALLALLDKLPEDAFPKSYVGGQEVQRIITSAGDIIIGGRENNIYDLDSPEMRDVVCVIDLGGNDIYREGTCNLDRPVFVIIDLHGNDTYTGSKPGIQGGSVLGVSLLVDCEGNDTYTASDVAQGSSLGGVGMLFDFAGDDNYRGLRRVQGHALCGVGILVDREGNDKYRAALWAQGFGAPGGFGVLNDVQGDDHYYCGGLYLDSYPEHPGYDGWGQGIGAGLRQVGNGGIGAFLDGAGDDIYEVDYFGHGGGYWLGIGFARDFGGNDIRHGTTLNAYNGGPRSQSRWTRFANGFGCHYSLGYCFDDNGNDTYGGTIMGTGMAWDLSIGFLCDFNGDNRFTATGGMTQGVGAEGSIGVLFCYGGNDTFLGRNQAYASPSITYHSPSNCGSNFSFLINYGGNNQYGCGARKGSYTQRGTSGGYLIDRPTQEEEAVEITRLKKMKSDRDKEIADWDAEQQRLRQEATQNNRRYVQRTRRPAPINIDLERRVSPVPSFAPKETRTVGTDVNVK